MVRKNRGQLLLTKGDNNYDDDIMLYNGPRWIRDDQIVGRVQGYVWPEHANLMIRRFLPYAGYVTILLNDYPMLKYVVLGLLGISLFFERE